MLYVNRLHLPSRILDKIPTVKLPLISKFTWDQAPLLMEFILAANKPIAKKNMLTIQIGYRLISTQRASLQLPFSINSLEKIYQMASIGHQSKMKTIQLPKCHSMTWLPSNGNNMHISQPKKNRRNEIICVTTYKYILK